MVYVPIGLCTVPIFTRMEVDRSNMNLPIFTNVVFNYLFVYKNLKVEFWVLFAIFFHCG